MVITFNLMDVICVNILALRIALTVIKVIVKNVKIILLYLQMVNVNQIKYVVMEY